MNLRTLSLLALVAAGCKNSPPPADPGPGPGPSAPATQQIPRAIRDLFKAYEDEDVQAFMAHVHPDFSGNDRTGNDYRSADLPRALRDDFAVMQRTRFDVRSGPPLVDEAKGSARVDVEWGLRFLPETGGDEQVLAGERSVLTFMRTPEGEWKLFSITGAPIFGVADREGKVRR